MKKKQGKKLKKKVSKVSKKVANKVKKLTKGKKAQSLLSNARKKMNAFTKQSSKSFKSVKDKAWATEEEIVKYVKANPIKSISTVALVTLIAGYVAKYKR